MQPAENRRSRNRKGQKEGDRQRQPKEQATETGVGEPEGGKLTVQEATGKKKKKKEHAKACWEARLPAKHMYKMNEGEKHCERESSSLRACSEESKSGN